MSHDNDPGENILAPVDLRAWRAPPPSATERSAILARVLSPAAPPGRSRGSWMLAALAIVNVVLVAIIVIVISRRPPQAITMLQPAGGGDADAQTQERLRRLEQQQRELERKLGDVVALRAAVDQLAERVRRCEQAGAESKARPAGPAPAPSATTNPSSRALPDTVDRDTITAGIDSIRSQVEACGRRSTAKGYVKVRVLVSPAGHADDVVIQSAPDGVLGACVASAVRSAIFEPTHHGGAFTYPFLFGAAP